MEACDASNNLPSWIKMSSAVGRGVSEKGGRGLEVEMDWQRCTNLCTRKDSVRV